MPRDKLIQLRRDTAANWTSTNPTLAAGEGGFETNTGKAKIGDGSTAWNSLAYLTAVTLTGAVTGSGTGSFATTLAAFTALTSADVNAIQGYNDDQFPYYDAGDAANRRLLASRQYGFMWPMQVRLCGSNSTTTTTDSSSITNLFLMSVGGGRVTLHDTVRPTVYHIGKLGIGLALSGLSASTRYQLELIVETGTVSNSNATTEVLTLPGASAMNSGAQIIFYSLSGVGGITNGQFYYWHKVTTTTGTIHSNPTDAISGTSPVNITANGLTASYLALTLQTNTITTWADIDDTNSGIQVVSTDSTRLIVGTIKATGATTTADWQEQRLIASMYNPVARTLWKCPGYSDNNAATSYTIGTSLTEANGAGNGRVEWESCREEAVSVKSAWEATANAGGAFRGGTKVDSTSTDIDAGFSVSVTSATECGATAWDKRYAAGSHYAALVGFSASGNATIFADRARGTGTTTDVPGTYISVTINP